MGVLAATLKLKGMYELRPHFRNDVGFTPFFRYMAFIVFVIMFPNNNYIIAYKVNNR